MRLLISGVALVVGVFLAFVVQAFIPPVGFLHGGRIVLVPMIFCYAAMVFPTWAMVLAALYTGLLTDLAYLHVVDGRVEIGLGFSIVFFVVFGLLANGFQPAFRRGHWWIHALLAALGTSAFLAAQFLMITFRREGFVVNELVAWRILGPGVVAGLLAPFFHLIVAHASQFLPEDFASLATYRPSR
jgi:hypothetical protein